MYLTSSKFIMQILSFYRHQSFLLFSLLFIISSISLTAQDFQLASNNKTITCDAADVGDTGVVNGKTYTKVDETQLRNKIANGDDVTCVCTSEINNMRVLFNNNTSFNQDISSWDVSDVSNMESIFQGASSFNQDIGYWDISSMNNPNGVNNMFANSGLTADLSYWCFPTENTYQNRTNIYGNSSITGYPRWAHINGTYSCRTAKVAPAPSGSNSPATLTITSNDSDNVITTGQVTLTATFSINMNASPTISISGVVTNVAMTQSTTAAVWTYYWQVPSNIS